MSDFIPRTSADLDDLFGTDDRPAVVSQPEPGDDLPDLHALAEDQFVKAVYRIHEDKSNYPRFPIPTLDALAGAHAPDELWFWMARQANGKSLAMQNLAEWNIAQGIPTLYIGTEQDAEVLRVKQACIRAGVKAKLILKPTQAQLGTTEYQTACDAVQRELKVLHAPDVRQLLIFANTRYVSRAILAKWIPGAVAKYGVLYVIVDHIDHMDHGEGRNAPQELKQSVHLLKDLACRHHISIMAASQVRRASEALENFMPPRVDQGFGGSAKEHTADVILGGWRPLRTDMDTKDLRELMTKAREGKLEECDVYQRDTMGVRVLKDRLGDAPGQQCYLSVTNGRLTAQSEKDRYQTGLGGVRV